MKQNLSPNLSLNPFSNLFLRPLKEMYEKRYNGMKDWNVFECRYYALKSLNPVWVYASASQ
jgi:hypothetical protein